MKKMMRIIAVAAMTLISWQAMSQVNVGGYVLEQDGNTPIENAVVTFSGITFSGDTLVYQFFTDTLGAYGDSLVEGAYRVWASAEGYEPEYLEDSLQVVQGYFYSNLDFILHETYVPVRYVAARQYAPDLVRVSWSMNEPLLVEDFEMGDFDRFNWNNSLSDHPWAIDTLHAYEGRCCMKSTCEGVSSGVSRIEVSVYVPLEGKMGFQSKIASESPWDMGRFYLDGVKMMECSGEEDWTGHQYDITIGEHVFRWDYVKDASTDVGDDCFYVDDIHFYLDDSTKSVRSFQYYDLFRSRSNEAPVMMASHLTDTVFMDMNWGSLPWGQYRWGVSCYYEGNRSGSDTIWSAYLDKDMSTTFELVATTNVDVPPAGATVVLTSHEGQGHEYQATLDANGRLLLPGVYRDYYDVRVSLDGFLDYVSDSAISVFAPAYLEVELTEAMNGVDSLYVSSTGWAMWSVGDAQNRDLQYFELMLNGEPVGVTTSCFFQFDVSSLAEGEVCLAQVRPVYLSGACDWCSCSWEYHTCDGFAGSDSGLNWSLHNEAIVLSWVYPEGGCLGAVLFRDGEYLGFTEVNTFTDVTAELHGELTYCLRLVYDGAHDGMYYSMACEECVVASFPAYCDPPTKLEGENFLDEEGNFGALISWGERPEPVEQWMNYDDGTFKRALGGDNDPLIFWGVRFDREMLSDYVGTALQKVSLFDVGAGTYHLWIYVGGETEPRTLVRSQNMTLTNAHAWHEERVEPAVAIPEDEPIWVVVGQQGLPRPAAASADMGHPDGRWVSLDGESWTDMHTFNMHYTWMLRAFVSNRSGHSKALDDEGYSLQSYQLYRSYDNIDYQSVATIPVEEGQLFYQYRDYLMDDPHHVFYYALTAVYLSDDGEVCESEYAAALHHPNLHYVWVDDAWLLPEDNRVLVDVYPNPVQGWLHVEARSMHGYSVYDAMGRLVKTGTTTSDSVDLDFSGCPDGLYCLKVETQDGAVFRRFVVAR